MSLREREDGADDDAEPEDLPNLVRRERCPLCADARQGGAATAFGDGQNGSVFLVRTMEESNA